jgi:hypothetical protein
MVDWGALIKKMGPYQGEVPPAQTSPPQKSIMELQREYQHHKPLKLAGHKFVKVVELDKRLEKEKQHKSGTTGKTTRKRGMVVSS